MSNGLLWAVGVTAASSNISMGPERALTVVFIGTLETCTPGTFLYIKKNGNTIVSIYRP